MEKPVLPNRSLIPKMNSTSESQSKVAISKLNQPIVSPQTSVVDNSDKNRGAPTNTKNKNTKNDKNLTRESKVAKRARLLAQRKNDEKSREVLKKRELTRNDFLALAGVDEDTIKDYPTDEGDMLTSESEGISNS
ncbi:hypothetical protein AVEN_125062-1 [Araneus ventricosus]|uniref:Uncharacterized protein n=1 Tax=Araneus ventricosus TaxID=182803 RepID=A0A4Y2GTR7_ARAVE|nr:hypothetical protein AVEN_125062-1 [Araneus ventricosus]